MEIILKVLNDYPIVATVYIGMTGAYTLFCAVASLTKNKSDDVWADKLKRFFSLPIKK